MSYAIGLESKLIQGDELDSRPWDLNIELFNVFEESDTIMAIGWSTVRELFPVARLVSSVVGLEPVTDVRHRSAVHIAHAALTNVQMVNGAYYNIPYKDESFDAVISTGTLHDTGEIHRVLKPGGMAILEQVGEQDNNVLKAFFGSDERGKRGQFADLQPNERAAMYRQEFGALFSKYTVRQGYWSTLLTEEGLDLLLAQTPTIRNYDPQRDKANLQAFKDRYMEEDYVQVTQHRILITAIK